MEKSISEFRLVGLRLNGKTTNDNNQSSIDCGNLWQQFEKDRIIERIPDKLSDDIYAVYFGYEKDETAAFSYFIGCPVENNSDVPEGLTTLLIPAQSYLVFKAQGEMPVCMADTWSKIWSSEINRRFTFDFEVYDERSHDWDNAEVDIYVATE
jgi:predicted transcriptional regulator YdeE